MRDVFIGAAECGTFLQKIYGYIINEGWNCR